MARYGIVLGMHTSIAKGISKYGSIKAMPQYPIMRQMSEKGTTFVFSCDFSNYTGKLPRNCIHIRIWSRLTFLFFSWLFVSYYARRFNMNLLYYQSGSSVPAIPFVNRITNSKVLIFCGVLFHRSPMSVNPLRKSLTAKEFIYLMIEKFAFRFVDYVISGSTEITMFLKSVNGFRGKVLPVKKGIRLPKKEKSKFANKRVIWSGRLEFVKNPLLAVYSFIWYVLPKHPDAELLICGNGSLLEELRKSTKKYLNIQVLGHVHNLYSLMSESSIYLSTSIYEGSSDAIVEAMAIGLPVVATDVGGTKDYVIDNETGILCDLESFKQIGEAICYFFDNPKIAWHMGQIGKEIVHEHYDIEKNTAKLLGLLEQ